MAPTEHIDESEVPLLHRLLQLQERLLTEQAADREDRRADREQRLAQTHEIGRMAAQWERQNEMLMGVFLFLTRHPIGMGLTATVFVLLFGAQFLQIMTAVRAVP